MFKEWLESIEQASKYQSIPFWSWNDKLEEKQLVTQIEWMKESGIGGFLMHARGGLQTEYLSDEWMQCVKTSAIAATERDMQAWIYDENGWPSGFVGGKLLENEDFHDRYLSYSIGEYDEEAWVVYAVEESCIYRLEEHQQGECLNVYLHISPSSVDILNGEVTQEFLKKTHEKYATYFGEEFTKYISGFFTDEPQYYRWQTPYTRMMPQAYMEKYGEDLLDNLGLLFVKKEGYQEFRYRYWYLMQQLMLRNYAKKIYTWCQEHEVMLTGHYVEENTLAMQMTCCAGIMPFYEYMHMPGIDWLKRGERSILALRQVTSVARQLGKEQILTETFGCCGWDVTPTELRIIADFQYIGGVNRMCHHLIPYSEYGQRKRDFPAHFSTINPWTDEYFREFNDYFTRMGYILANSKEPVKVAVLHPIRSAYFEFGFCNLLEGKWECGNIRELDRTFNRQLEQLAFAQIPFHLLDETLLERHGFVKNGKIGCGLCEYEYLVIPKCYTMGRYTEQMLREYVEQGGKVLLLDEKPTYLEGKPYEYPYLESNITFEDLSRDLPYRLQAPIPQVHATLRQYQDSWFLVVQNYGQSTQTLYYELMDEYSSFQRWDLTTMTSKNITTDVVLRAGESCILQFSKQEAVSKEEKNVLHLPLEAEITTVTDNYLTLDMARYSKDGINYSELLPCMGIFQLLLEERYCGPIHLKYEFQVKETPKYISLVLERGNGAEMQVDVNHHLLQISEQWERDHQFMKDDISPWVITGKNEIHMQFHFYQSEAVYYALYGENVTENLRNCLCYNTAIEAVYLAGDFGVYSNNMTEGKQVGVILGSDFYIGKKKNTVRNIITDGYPFFAGKMTLKREIEIENTDVILEFKGRFQAMRIWVNGQEAGNLLYDNLIDISKNARVGTNEIVMELVVSNRNLLGPHHYIEEEPHVVTPEVFELPGTWRNGRSSEYRDSYSFVVVPMN